MSVPTKREVSGGKMTCPMTGNQFPCPKKLPCVKVCADNAVATKGNQFDLSVDRFWRRAKARPDDPTDEKGR